MLLNEALKGAKDAGAKTEKVILNALKFSPCQECENIRDDKSCIIEDDMQAIYKKIKNADALILASPIFFGSLSAQMKMMIDRFQCAWKAKYILKKDIFKRKKVGMFISVAASDRKYFFDNAKSIVKNFFAIVNTTYKKELFCSNVEKKGDILRKSHCLKKAYELGKGIVK